MAPTLIGDRTAPRIGGVATRGSVAVEGQGSIRLVGGRQAESTASTRGLGRGPLTPQVAASGLVRRGFEPRQPENDPGRGSLRSLPRVAATRT
jgi:hypothetical protein